MAKNEKHLTPPGPLKLMQTRRYTGYSFRVFYQVDGLSPEEALKYSVLRVTSWLCDKLDKTGYAVSQLPEGGPEDYKTVDDTAFHSFHTDEGVAIDVTSLLSKRIWTLKIKEPDAGVNQSPVTGRFFVTDVGLRLTEDGFVDLGCRITIIDPKDQTDEVPYAFRPAIIRAMFEDERVKMRPDQFYSSKPFIIGNDNSLRDFRRLLADPANAMPCVVFTPANRDVVSPQEVIAFLAKDPPRAPFSTQESVLGHLKKAQAEREAAEQKPIVFDTEEFARKVQAYARVFVLEKGMETKFRNQCGDFRRGAAILFDARKFRSGRKEFFAAASAGQMEIASRYGQLLEETYVYGKHKEWDFTDLLFQDDAEQQERRLQLEEIRNSKEPDSEKIQKLLDENRRLLDQHDMLQYDCYQLSLQNEKERQLGREEAQGKVDELTQKLEEVTAERNAVAQKLFRLEALNSKVVEEFEEEVPTDWSYDRAAEWVQMYYPERLVLLSRAEHGLRKSQFVDSELVYKTLKVLANEGYEHFVAGHIPYADFNAALLAADSGLVEDGVSKACASNTPEQYYVAYNGKTRMMERHVKHGKIVRDPRRCMRIYFFGDKDTGRLVIGWLTSHLDTATT